MTMNLQSGHNLEALFRSPSSSIQVLIPKLGITYSEPSLGGVGSPWLCGILSTLSSYLLHELCLTLIYLIATLLKVKFAQSCLTLCSHMDYKAHGILQARKLEWVAFPFSRDLSNQGMEPRSPALRVGLPHCGLRWQ